MSDGIQFFGNIDKTKDGEVASEMPAWFFDVQVDKLIENVEKRERAIVNGTVPPDHIWNEKNEVANLKKKITEIQMSKPTLKGGQKDMVYKEYQNLQKQIADSLPTRKEDRDGLVNPRDELKRMKSPHIDISPKMAEACGIKTSGKISGDQANRCYKMMGSILGENTNVERIRKEGHSESYRTMEDLTKQILNKVG